MSHATDRIQTTSGRYYVTRSPCRTRVLGLSIGRRPWWSPNWEPSALFTHAEAVAWVGYMQLVETVNTAGSLNLPLRQMAALVEWAADVLNVHPAIVRFGLDHGRAADIDADSGELDRIERALDAC